MRIAQHAQRTMSRLGMELHVRTMKMALTVLGTLALFARTASARRPVHPPNPPSVAALTCTVNYSGTTGNLAYQSGAVVSNVEAIPVFWTAAVDPAIQAWAVGYLSTLTNSAYIDLLGEYSTIGQARGTAQAIGRGTAGPAVTITPIMLTGTSINDANRQIATELQAQITAGHLSAPAMDSQGRPNTVYVVFFPPGTTINDGVGPSCTSWCAYHNEGGRSGNINYTVIPDMGPASACNTGCDDQCTTDNVGISRASVSHELAEAITDPSRGWADPSGNGVENGDICTTKGGVQKDEDVVPGTTIKAQYLWSQRYKQCLLAPPGWDGGAPADAGAAQDGAGSGNHGGGGGGNDASTGTGASSGGGVSSGGAGLSGDGASGSGGGSGSGATGDGDASGAFGATPNAGGCACDAGASPVATGAIGVVPLIGLSLLLRARRRRG
jgi:uncharacterized membrane protein YgcG